MRNPARIYVIPALTLVVLGQVAPASAWAQTGTDIDQVTLTADKSPAVVRHRQLESVLGKEVRTRVEQDVGRVIDILADHQGRLQAAVIEFGGFLGIGTRKIAVEWPALSFENDGKQPVVIVDMTRDQLRVAPEYKPNEPAVVRRASE
jgi:predicted O-methyltransferase YrrM